MKGKNKIIIGCLLAAVSFGNYSCEDFLEEKPQSFLSPENYYQDERDLFAALIGVYESLGDNSQTFLARRLHYLTWFTSGEALSPNLSNQQLLTNYTYTADHSDINSVWTSMYATINKANTVIGRAAEVPMDENLKQQYVAEARFLRALSYFYGVRLWGALPLVTEEVTAIDEVNVARSPISDIYNLIIEDLEFASGLVPATNQQGRAIKGAVKGLLAKVYLTRASSEAAGSNDYQLCADLCKEVIEMPEHHLMPDYQQVFGPSNEFNPESLFEWQGDRNLAPVGEHSPLGAFTMPRGIKMFEEQGPSDGGSIVSTVEYFNLYQEQDYRRESTFVTEGTTFDGEYLTWQQFVNPYPAPCLKYVDRTATSRNGFEWGGNFIVLRLADLYLMRAEALNEINGPTSEAYAMINAIRERTRNRDGDSTSAFPADVSGLDKAAFRDTILRERAVELGFEGHRWFDLVRTGRLVETIKSIDSDYPVSEKHRLFPIPPDELILNEKLTQNTGW
ncbi:putative outer membrane starch-binding protein [Anseongella ginsenosidimutans]|uniref:Putative outer membrane starch-binding protein n=1 Tax=Anseongella ginsenosidimutans TaxID=496056 RepID=A0A4R3KP51_9SPHI|nr:RagB/SusD family nutrient uptake outer membrane protein [Anseongella ginsenosidimutans]QEC52359.1 RagB/SusD family nutrient uptake outer membrane protein [Anseongella ginsenosidimutans]TCS85898.1 putative outer membrane starch-binding protein [Anseongella ginsenosidimutans]